MNDTTSAAREGMLALMGSIATVLENTPVGDGKSGKSDNWAPNGLAVRCKLQMNDQGRKGTVADRKTEESKYKVIMPWDAPVTVKNRLRIAGTDYTIQGTNGEVPDRLTLVAYCEVGK